MPRDRYFVPGRHALGDRLQLGVDDARKLATVLRGRTGDRAQLIDAAGTAFDARLEFAGRTVTAVLEGILTDASRESGVRIVLGQALPKAQKMDFIVEKATELGVAAIVPLRTARTTGDHAGTEKRERWQRIARAAAQQSGRTRIPTIEDVADWTAALASFERFDRVYVAWEGAPAGSSSASFADVAGAQTLLLLVGPEGGWADEEIAAASAAGARPLSLGPRVLRTETAALVALAALLYARGEL